MAIGVGVQRGGIVARGVAKLHVVLTAAFFMGAAGFAYAQPAAGYDDSLLWRVEAGAGAVSYVYGTMHVEDPRVIQWPDAVDEALARADTFLMEIVLDPDVMGSVAQAMFAPPEDQGLAGHVDDGFLEALYQALEPYGIPPMLVDRMRAWAAIVVLNSPPPETGMFLDRLLHQAAVAQGMDVAGLETVEEQLAPFRDLDRDVALDLLERTVAQRDEIALRHETLISLYADGDLRGLLAAYERHLAEEDGELVARVMEGLVVARNARMAERLGPYLDAGGAFVAIGALHLPGPDGVLARLAERGYAVTPVDAPR